MNAKRQFGLGLLVTGICIALLVRVIDWSATADALASANPWLIGLAVSCLLVSLTFKTARWRLLLPAGAEITTPRLFRILHISFFLNNVLPARLGDVARVALTTRQPGLRFGHVVSSLLTERVVDGLTLLAGFVIVSPLLPLADSYRSWLHIAWAAIGGLVLMGGAIVLGQRLALHRRAGLTLPGRFSWPRRLRDEAASFREGWRQLFARDHVFTIWGCSWAAWLLAFAINYLLMQALHIDAPITVAVLLTCTTNLAMLLPSSPGYVGVFHAAATLSLVPFNIDASPALSFAILAHLVNVVPVSLLGAVFLLANREPLALRRKPAPDPDQTVA